MHVDEPWSSLHQLHLWPVLSVIDSHNKQVTVNPKNSSYWLLTRIQV